jgi:phosphoglycolate phosphatase
MSKKLIIFDMDGTLVNSAITIGNAINFVRKNLGFEPMLQENILRLVNDHNINPAQTFYHAKAFDADHEKWFSEYYSKNHEKELALYEGIEALLHTLKAQGYLLAVATNAYRNSTIQSLTHLKVLELFDAIICHDDVSQSKPNPEMLETLLKDLNTSADQALFIGDAHRDEETAQRANIGYIMVDWGFSDYKNAVSSITSLKALIANHP